MIDHNQEKLNEKRMSIRPKKEETEKARITDMYGSCQENSFNLGKAAVAKCLGEQPANAERIPTFLLRLGTEVGRRRIIERRDNGEGGKSEDFPP